MHSRAYPRHLSARPHLPSTSSPLTSTAGGCCVLLLRSCSRASSARCTHVARAAHTPCSHPHHWDRIGPTWVHHGHLQIGEGDSSYGRCHPPEKKARRQTGLPQHEHRHNLTQVKDAHSSHPQARHKSRPHYLSPRTTRPTLATHNTKYDSTRPNTHQ